MNREELSVKLAQIEEELLSTIGLLHLVPSEPDEYSIPFKTPPPFEIGDHTLEWFITQFTSNPYNSHSVLNGVYETFDSEEKSTCKRSAFRSTGDMFLLAKTYFPELTYEDVLTAIVNLDNNNEIDYYYCKDVGKRVMCGHNVLSSLYTTQREQDEHGLSEADLNLLIK